MHLLLFFLLTQGPVAPNLALVLSPGDDERVLDAALAFSRKRGWQQAPLIIAMEPGPIDMQRGLRLLPNEIPPRLSTPRILVINNGPNFQPELSFIAFLRRCLEEDTKVIVCGDNFPEILLDGALLKPGQKIALSGVAELEARLDELDPPIRQLPFNPIHFLHWNIP